MGIFGKLACIAAAPFVRSMRIEVDDDVDWGESL